MLLVYMSIPLMVVAVVLFELPGVMAIYRDRLARRDPARVARSVSPREVPGIVATYEAGPAPRVPVPLTRVPAGKKEKEVEVRRAA